MRKNTIHYFKSMETLRTDASTSILRRTSQSPSNPKWAITEFWALAMGLSVCPTIYLFRRVVPPWLRTSTSLPRSFSQLFPPCCSADSPEAKVAKQHSLVRIVKLQLQSYNPEANADLTQFIETHLLDDGDKFCAAGIS